MAKDDLRWRRTERNLMDAFGSALSERPLDKITVTSLAREADINKATFYLHYRDVYDLADAYARLQARRVAQRICETCEFFDEPEGSARGLIEGIEASKDVIAALMDNRLMPQFIDEMALCIVVHIDGEEFASRDLRARMMVTFVVEGALHLLWRYADTEPDELYETLVDVFGGLRATKSQA